MFIYIIVCAESSKIYIGQHKGQNLQKYLQTKISDAFCGRGGRSHLYAAMRKHPRESWFIYPLVSDVQTRSELDALEQRFIRVLKTQHPDVGYNIARGGEGFTGSHTDEARSKILAGVRKYWSRADSHVNASRRLSNRWKNSPEYRERMVVLAQNSHHNLGRVQSEEEKQKRSTSLKGRKKTTDHQNHITLALRGRKIPSMFKGGRHAALARYSEKQFLKTVAWG